MPLSTYTKNCLTPVRLCDGSVTVFSPHLILKRDIFESCLFCLLWRRCSQNISGRNNYFHYRRRTTSLTKERFSAYNSELHRLTDWLHTNNCFDICMEATGKYWVPVFNILEERGIRMTIANPKWVKAVKGNKDNTKDSKWIGDLFRLGLVPSSFIPSKKIRILRKFTRCRYKLVSMKSSEKKHFQNTFIVCNVALDSIVSICSENLQLPL